MAENENTLVSKSILTVVDAVCEGTIEGFAPSTGIVGNYNTGLLPYRSIYFDDVPLISSLGTVNFPITGDDFAFSFTSGTNNQSLLLPYNAQVEWSLPLPTDTEIKRTSFEQAQDQTKNVYVSFNTKDYPEASYVRINIRVPALFQTKSNGDIDRFNMGIVADVSVNGSGYQPLFYPFNLIDGKTNGNYYKSITAQLPNQFSDNTRYTIRIGRGDPTQEKFTIQNSSFVDSVVVGSRTKLKYPNTVLAAWKFNSQDFGGVPSRKYHIKGLKVKIPNNYNPITREYTGIWNGTFKTTKEWTQNPAWILYDLITNARYGLGNYIKEDWVNKWTLYEIAQECDRMVDDGNGGLEPNFTCNVVIYNEEDAYDLLQKFVSIFRGMLYWANGSVYVSQDNEKNPVYNFTNANVVDGVFSYSSSAQKVRHTVALVKWVDPANLFKETTEVVQDTDGILKYGYQEISIDAFGCTSKGQALRLGRWLLTTENLLTETVSFRTGPEGYYLKPGDVINVYDNYRINSQQGGRVIGFNATRNEITLDRPVDLLDGNAYNLSIVTPSGALFGTGDITGSSQISQIRQSQVTFITVLDSAQNDIQTLTVNGSYPSTLQTGAIWILDGFNTGNLNLSIQSERFKVLSTKETEPNVVEVLGVDYSTGKFAFIETGYGVIEIEDDPITGLLVAPSNLDFSLTKDIVTETLDLGISWDGVPSGSSGVLAYYEVYGKYENTGIYQLVGRTIGNSVEVDLTDHVQDWVHVDTGFRYHTEIYSVDKLGNFSLPLSGNHFVSLYEYSGILQLKNLKVEDPNAYRFPREYFVNGGITGVDLELPLYAFTGRTPLLSWEVDLSGRDFSELYFITGFSIEFKTYTYPAPYPDSILLKEVNPYPGRQELGDYRTGNNEIGVSWSDGTLALSGNSFTGNPKFFYRIPDSLWIEMTGNGDPGHEYPNEYRQPLVFVKSYDINHPKEDSFAGITSGQIINPEPNYQLYYRENGTFYRDTVDFSSTINGFTYSIPLATKASGLFFGVNIDEYYKRSNSDFSGIRFWFSNQSFSVTGNMIFNPDLESNALNGTVSVPMSQTGNSVYIRYQVVDTFGYDQNDVIEGPVIIRPNRKIEGVFSPSSYSYQVLGYVMETGGSTVTPSGGGGGFPTPFNQSNGAYITGALAFGIYGSGGGDQAENSDPVGFYRVNTDETPGSDKTELRLVIGDNGNPSVATTSYDKFIIGVNESTEVYKWREKFIFESTGRLYMPSGHVRDDRTLDYFNLSMFLGTPFAGSGVIETIFGNSFYITGYAISCITAGSTNLQGSIYECSLANTTKKGLATFTLTAGSTNTISAVPERLITGRRKLGIDLWGAPDDIEGLSISVWGYKVQ